jgi:hypothetical protein
MATTTFEVVERMPWGLMVLASGLTKTKALKVARVHGGTVRPEAR